MSGKWTLRPAALIGMVHVHALPGSPASRRPLAEIVEQAVGEARILAEAGFDGLIVENMHDRPYLVSHGPEIVASMTRVALAVREAAPNMVMGVQVLALGHVEALAIAHAVAAQFVRVENFTFAHVADEGVMPEAAAGKLLRYRRQIGAEGIRLACDVKKKHAAHAITADVPLADAARSAEFFGADAVIVSGGITGAPTKPSDALEARRGCTLPVWIGSGATPEQLPTLLNAADAVIVGTWTKYLGEWTNPVDPVRCKRMVEEADRLRG